MNKIITIRQMASVMRGRFSAMEMMLPTKAYPIDDKLEDGWEWIRHKSGRKYQFEGTEHGLVVYKDIDLRKIIDEEFLNDVSKDMMGDS